MDNNIYTPGRGGQTAPTSVANNSIDPAETPRTFPRQVSTGSTRGTQTVGYGSTLIDGTNNRITIGAPDGSSIGMGAIPNSTTNEYGFFTVDKSGKVILKIVGGTMFVYDPSNGYVNVTQSGLLPDGSGGFVVANPGTNVSAAFS